MAIVLFLIGVVVFCVGLIGALAVTWRADQRWPTAIVGVGVLINIVGFTIEAPVQPDINMSLYHAASLILVAVGAPWAFGLSVKRRVYWPSLVFLGGLGLIFLWGMVAP